MSATGFYTNGSLGAKTPQKWQKSSLVAELKQQQKEAARLDKLVWAKLGDVGYGG